MFLCQHRHTLSTMSADKDPEGERGGEKEMIIGSFAVGVLYQICFITWVNIELGEDSVLACRHLVWCAATGKLMGFSEGKLAGWE